MSRERKTPRLNDEHVNRLVCSTAIRISNLYIPEGKRYDLGARFAKAVATIGGYHPNSSFWSEAMDELRTLGSEAAEATEREFAKSHMVAEHFASQKVD